MHKLFCIFFIISICYSESNKKIITIGGSVTEIVFELGLGDEVIAVDQSSVSPSIVTKLPQVGYIRMISAEGILSLNPDIILTTTDIGPPKVVDQLKKSGVDLYIYESAYSLKGILSLIKNISNNLNVNKIGLELINEINIIDKKIEKLKNNNINKPNMIFFMNPSIGSFTAAGGSTKADYFIEYLGGNNIFSNQFKKYNKVTKENIVNLNPDFILAGSTRGDNEEDILSIFYNKGEFKSVNAIKDKNVIYINMGKYLTFGSNFTKNVLELLNQIKN